jgi:hypothetical protein
MWQFASRYAVYLTHITTQRAYTLVYMHIQNLHPIYHRSATCMCACGPCTWPFGAVLNIFSVIFISSKYVCLKLCSFLNQPPCHRLNTQKHGSLMMPVVLNRAYRLPCWVTGIRVKMGMGVKEKKKNRLNQCSTVT